MPPHGPQTKAASSGADPSGKRESSTNRRTGVPLPVASWRHEGFFTASIGYPFREDVARWLSGLGSATGARGPEERSHHPLNGSAAMVLSSRHLTRPRAGCPRRSGRRRSRCCDTSLQLRQRRRRPHVSCATRSRRRRPSARRSDQGPKGDAGRHEQSVELVGGKAGAGEQRELRKYCGNGDPDRGPGRVELRLCRLHIRALFDQFRRQTHGQILRQLQRSALKLFGRLLTGEPPSSAVSGVVRITSWSGKGAGGSLSHEREPDSAAASIWAWSRPGFSRLSSWRKGDANRRSLLGPEHNRLQTVCSSAASN